MTTIGYGVSDYYFGDCWLPLVLVLMQVCCALTFDAVAIGLIFQRISRGQKRSKTIIFSDKAVVRYVRGIPYLMFRIGELRRHQIIEAQVRAYCIRHERHLMPNADENQDINSETMETVYHVARAITFVHPDEQNVGSHILMSLPQVIVHRMDSLSPLLPPPIWYDANGEKHTYTPVTPGSEATRNTTIKDEVEPFLLDREVELVVLVEGTDDFTGAPVQARHSYRFDEFEW
eukprot:CAMPEP_0118683522 /NCGR_PEP_ID=MMETSP0800-20121206/6100_1 /TAXON_ID=210618 ORGANISM="Striatella unipunctata, Strain CCMP2910" /NCGR_SAMPLE_ID=MMETSP0800 /ASSEMBLY_ACC=CAM_ASM_000638 /LENGTH=231 /DNA_ID=CAMNT_0006580057 /DNA_START=365 /DNA_END=1057 /DNA_ORIENTATION=-